MSEALESTFQRTVDEGYVRLTRTWPSLLATGVVGGIDVGRGSWPSFSSTTSPTVRFSEPWRSASASSR